MPTKRERDYYRMGFEDGIATAEDKFKIHSRRRLDIIDTPDEYLPIGARKPKRKLSAWNKYVKNKRNHITYRDGKLNLKKMAVAFRRKKRR